MTIPAPRTDWREDIPPDEDRRFEAHAQTLRKLQEGHGERHGGMSRALHAKGHLGVHASFEVLEAPPDYKAGLFARPASYRALVRFSNGAGAHQPDKAPDVRGFAVKLLGVPGKKLIPGLENATTQDFLAIHTPSTPFRNADEFVGAIQAGRSKALALPRFFAAFGPRRALAIIKGFVATAGAKIPTLAQQRFWSALPIRYGAYAAKYAFIPAAGTPPGAPALHTHDFFGKDLAERLARAPLVYDFAVQLYRDPERTPIEDGSVEWREADAPFVTVGRLTIPVQDVNDARGRKLADRVEQLSFDPWHALVEHRPLGNMMRARNHAYRVSTQTRHAAAEPDASESFD
jgi:hypothetical protein